MNIYLKSQPPINCRSVLKFDKSFKGSSIIINSRSMMCFPKPTKWSVSLNEDKQAIMRPIRDKSWDTPTPLTYAEINELSEVDQQSYHEAQTDRLFLDPHIGELHEELIREDRRIHELEQEMEEINSDDD
jgi:hypothetical protein